MKWKLISSMRYMDLWIFFFLLRFIFILKIYPQNKSRIIIYNHVWHFYHVCYLEWDGLFLCTIWRFRFVESFSDTTTQSPANERKTRIWGMRRLRTEKFFRPGNIASLRLPGIRERCLKCLQNLPNPSERVICEYLYLTRDGFIRSHERRRAYGKFRKYFRSGR